MSIVCTVDPGFDQIAVAIWDSSLLLGRNTLDMTDLARCLVTVTQLDAYAVAQKQGLHDILRADLIAKHFSLVLFANEVELVIIEYPRAWVSYRSGGAGDTAGRDAAQRSKTPQNQTSLGKLALSIGALVGAAASVPGIEVDWRHPVSQQMDQRELVNRALRRAGKPEVTNADKTSAVLIGLAGGLEKRKTILPPPEPERKRRSRNAKIQGD